MYGFLLCFCSPYIGPLAIPENNVLQLANHSERLSDTRASHIIRSLLPFKQFVLLSLAYLNTRINNFCIDVSGVFSVKDGTFKAVTYTIKH